VSKKEPLQTIVIEQLGRRAWVAHKPTRTRCWNRCAATKASKHAKV
jgi:hypothetical protein